MALCRAAVFLPYGRSARKQLAKQPTDTPTSTMALMCHCPSFMVRLPPTLRGCLTGFAPMGSIKRFLADKRILRQEKRAQRLTSWVRRPPGGVGVLHAKGWGSKSSCPPSKVRLPWVSKGGTWDVPGILRGCPEPLGVFKKFLQKKVCAHFSAPKICNFTRWHHIHWILLFAAKSLQTQCSILFSGFVLQFCKDISW